MTGGPPSRRISRSDALAALLAAASLVLLAAAVVSLFLPGADRYPNRPAVLDVVLFLAALTSFPVVGYLIASRRPENPVGWLFLLFAMFVTIGLATGAYAEHVAFGGHPLPGGPIADWLGTWSWSVAFGITLPLAILLFPGGRFLSPKWRLAGRMIVVLAAIGVVATALAPEPSDRLFANPFALPGAAGDVAQTISDVFNPVMGFGLIAAALSLPVRYRRSGAIVRQQLRWFASSIALMAAGVGLIFVTTAFDGEGSPVAWYVLIAALALMPVTVGIAILRYRLYEIDVIIRRTLVYGALTAVLGVVYVGLVLALQALLSPLTGENTVAVALSTLAVAALFGPVRRPVQAAVDRRFYRSRYDAARTVEAFAAQLRDEVEFEAISRRLVAVAGSSVRPTSATVWLRERVSRGGLTR